MLVGFNLNQVFRMKENNNFSISTCIEYLHPLSFSD